MRESGGKHKIERTYPHSPTPIPGLTGLTVSGAAGEEAIAA
jgi:hypothetical protein